MESYRTYASSKTSLATTMHSIMSPFRSEISFSVELAQFEGFKDKREAQFIAGRKAATSSLKLLDVTASELPKGTEGETIWPDGTTGSISHSQNIAVAACSKTKDALGIGVDIEYKHTQRNEKIFKKLFLEEELKWLENQSDFLRSALLIFSAKESIYKAFFNASAKKLAWHDARILPQKDGAFEVAVLIKELQTIPLQLRYSENTDFIVTGALLNLP